MTSFWLPFLAHTFEPPHQNWTVLYFHEKLPILKDNLGWVWLTLDGFGSGFTHEWGWESGSISGSISGSSETKKIQIPVLKIRPSFRPVSGNPNWN
jgi:hypothetical protein